MSESSRKSDASVEKNVLMKVIKNWVKILWSTGFAGFGIFAAFTGLLTRAKEDKVAQSAPLLQRVMALGDLHAVKYTYRDIHDFETVAEPSPWLAALPGGNDLIHAVTRNSATLSFDGTVEAGVDLTRAKISRSAAGISIVLPAPKVFTPSVTAEVHDVHRGLVWRDNSITALAIEDAKTRFRETSIRQGILIEAKKDVFARVLSLAKQISSAPVSITFAAA